MNAVIFLSLSSIRFSVVAGAILLFIIKYRREMTQDCQSKVWKSSPIKYTGIYRSTYARVVAHRNNNCWNKARVTVEQRKREERI